MPLKLLVVDDHALFREGICHVLLRLQDPINILEASNCKQALLIVSETPDVDLVLLDLNLPDMTGFEALDTLTKNYPALPIVILSASNLRSDIEMAIEKGAVGFIHKDTSSAIMLGALNIILAGGIYVPPYSTQQSPTPPTSLESTELTPRQIEVLKRLSTGDANKVIAAEMNLSEATVKMHITAIFKSLGVSNRTQAALAAEKLGLF
jgi:DNA-binding NarL/FixJ family response regulator